MEPAVVFIGIGLREDFISRKFSKQTKRTRLPPLIALRFKHKKSSYPMQSACNDF